MTDTHIQLRNGPYVSMKAVLLAIKLEREGHVLAVEGDALRVSHGSALSTEDRALIRALRWHLMTIATYQATEEP